MSRITLLMAVAAGAFLTGPAQAAQHEVFWDGTNSNQWSTFSGGPGVGNWTNSATNGGAAGSDIFDVLGDDWAVNGYTDALHGASVIIDGSAPNSAVSYDVAGSQALGTGALMSQGSSLTISNGASLTLESPNGLGETNAWMDMDLLRLDGGTIKRSTAVGATTNTGVWTFGSFNQDDNNRWVDVDLVPLNGDTGEFGGDNDIDGFDFLRLQAGDTAATGPLNAFVPVAAGSGLSTTTYFELWEKQFGRVNPNLVDTRIDIVNGGQFISEGQVWLGSAEDFTINVTFTINNGSIDLSGGAVDGGLAGGGGALTQSLVLITNGADKFDEGAFPGQHGMGTPEPHTLYDNNIAFNFTGPGSITIDEGGILSLAYDPDLGPFGFGSVVMSAPTYQDLWDLNILQLNGAGGDGGLNPFPADFIVTGALGDPVYSLTSVAPSVGAGVGAVPEPTSALLAGIAALVVGLSTARRRRA